MAGICKQRFSVNKNKLHKISTHDVDLNLSDYKYRQQHKGKYEKKTSLLRAPRHPSRSDETEKRKIMLM